MIDMTDSANAGYEKCMEAVHRHQKAKTDEESRWKKNRD